MRNVLPDNVIQMPDTPPPGGGDPPTGEGGGSSPKRSTKKPRLIDGGALTHLRLSFVLIQTTDTAFDEAVRFADHLDGPARIEVMTDPAESSGQLRVRG